MERGKISNTQSRLFLALSLAVFAAAETFAWASQSWLVNNSSIANLLLYNRWYATIPEALTTGAAVFLVFGLVHMPRKAIATIVISGLALAALSFILSNNVLFKVSVQFSPGYFIDLVWAPVANLFNIGLGTAISAIVSFLFRSSLAKTGTMPG